MNEDLSEQVRRRYAGAALSVRSGGAACCDASGADMTGGGYSDEERRYLPQASVRASLGCGNPVALAGLEPGEAVLDLGSGGGIDVLLSARRVSPGGKVYGLDMTDEMLDLARENAREAGAENVEFLKGEIEDVPLPDEHVDVVISNCVINLSTDKERVIREAFRVLRPGGRLAVYDVVFTGSRDAVPEEALREIGLWTGCVAGALEVGEYESLLARAGFEGVSVEVTHTHDPEALGASGCCGGSRQQGFSVASAFVRARKPERGDR